MNVFGTTYDDWQVVPLRLGFRVTYLHRGFGLKVWVAYRNPVLGVLNRSMALCCLL